MIYFLDKLQPDSEQNHLRGLIIYPGLESNQLQDRQAR